MKCNGVAAKRRGRKWEVIVKEDSTWTWIFVVQLPSHVQLCGLTDCSMPGLPVPQHLPEFVQVHVHCIGDAIQPSHSLKPSSSALKSFPASGTFPVSWLFPSGDQNTAASPSASVLPVSIWGWFRLRLAGLISLLPGTLSFLQHRNLKASILWHSLTFCLLYSPALTTIHDH